MSDNVPTAPWSAQVAAELPQPSKEEVLAMRIAEYKMFELTVPRDVDIWVSIPCCVDTHVYKVDEGKACGAFFLNLRELGDSTTKEILNDAKNKFKARKGCGIAECPITLWEAMVAIDFPEFLHCIHRDCNLVDMKEGECTSHVDVGVGELIGNALKKFYKSFMDAHKVARGVIERPGARGLSAEALELSTKYPAVDTKRSGLPRTWRDHSVVLGLSHVLRFVESLDRSKDNLPLMDVSLQALMTLMRNMHLKVRPAGRVNMTAEQDFVVKVAQAKARMESTEERYDRRKRKATETVEVSVDDNLHFDKKIKLDLKVVIDDISNLHNLRVTNGLTDMTPDIHAERITLKEQKNYSQESSKARLTESVQYTRTWDRDLKCLVCPNKHNLVLSGQDLLLVIADQHVPVVLPGCGDGKGCIPVIRFSNLSLDKLFRLVLNPVVTSLTSHRNTEEINGGVGTLIAAALGKELKIRIGITSGTSENVDGPEAYSAQMQRLVLWSESDCFRKGPGKYPSSLIRLSFLCACTPHIASVFGRVADGGFKEVNEELKCEATRLARTLTIQKSHHSCGLSVSATEECYTYRHPVTKSYERNYRMMQRFTYNSNLVRHINYRLLTLNQSETFHLKADYSHHPSEARDYDHRLRPGYMAAWERIVYKELRRVAKDKMPGVDLFLRSRANMPNITMLDSDWVYGLMAAGDFPTESGYAKAWLCSNRAKHGDLFTATTLAELNLHTSTCMGLVPHVEGECLIGRPDYYEPVVSLENESESEGESGDEREEWNKSVPSESEDDEGNENDTTLTGGLGSENDGDGTDPGPPGVDNENDGDKGDTETDNGDKVLDESGEGDDGAENGGDDAANMDVDELLK